MLEWRDYSRLAPIFLGTVVVLDHSFVAYRLVRLLVYCTVIFVVYRSYHRVVSFVLWISYGSAHCPVFVSRIVQSSFRVSFGLHFAYRLFFVSRNKLLRSSCIALILRFTIVDGLLRDSAIPEAIPSSQSLTELDWSHVWNFDLITRLFVCFLWYDQLRIETNIDTLHYSCIYIFALKRTRICNRNIYKYTSFILLHLDSINLIPNASTTAEAHIGILSFIWFILGAKYFYYFC